MAITNQSTTISTITLPDSNATEQVTTNSNTVSTENMTTEFTKVKSSSKSYGKPNDELTETIVLTNNSTYEVSNISVLDTLSTGATFKTGSVTINGTAYASYNPITGFTLPSSIAASGGVATITYIITIDSDVSVNTITNTAAITYTADNTEFTENTNTVSIDVIINKLEITKTVNKNVAKSGDTITYTMVVANNGNIANTDINFTDPIPTGTTFVTGSVTIDSTSQPTYNPATGFALSDLEPSASTTVTFQVTVN